MVWDEGEKGKGPLSNDGTACSQELSSVDDISYFK